MTYGFVRKHAAKPHHSEVVQLELHPVICHAGCGLYYSETAQGDPCPECKSSPKSWAIGAVELIEVVVTLAFGNVNSTEFIRSLGPVAEHTKLTRKSLVADVSRATVTDKE
jgi:hypothetical protein